jgi:hypothetical protein
LFSSQPLPGNPWPHDMVITIEDDRQSLLELLWIREAWQLHPEGDDLPPELAAPPASLAESRRSVAPISAWRGAWPTVWANALQHAGAVRDPGIVDRLRAGGMGTEERAQLLRELVGPSWRDDVGAEAITDEFDRWVHSRFEDRMVRSSAGFEAQPERAALGAVIEAWQRGMTTVVEIPCRGSFTRRIGPRALLVTADTRADPARYSAALREFR